MNDRLYRSRDDRIIAGVAGGVADRLNIDPTIVRVLWVILVPVTGGFMFLLYIVMAFIVPQDPLGDERWASWAGGGAWSMGAGGGPSGGATGPAATGAGPAAEPSAGAGPAGGTEAGPADAAAPGSPAGDTPPAPAAPPPPPGPIYWRDQRHAERMARRADRAAWRAEHHRDGTGVVIFGIILVLVGAFFLARAYIPDLDSARLWPAMLIVIGVAFLAGSIRRSDR